MKILHEGYGGRDESIKRFLREARAASLINHPNIVDVTDFGKSSDGTVFFVMELLAANRWTRCCRATAASIFCARSRSSTRRRARWARRTPKGIVHRDLKPENIMLTPREGRRELIRQITRRSGTAHDQRAREGVRLRKDP